MDFWRPLTVATSCEITLERKRKKEQGVSLGNSNSQPRVDPVPFRDLPHTGQKQGPREIVNFFFFGIFFMG